MSDPIPPTGDENPERAHWHSNLDWTVIAIPLFAEMREHESETGHVFDVIVDLNLTYDEGRVHADERAQALVIEVIEQVPQSGPDAQARTPGLDSERSKWTPQYVFASLTADQIRELARRDDPAESGNRKRSVYKIWPDHEVHALLTQSVSTVKADAARIAFGAVGAGIVWAVVDSGVDGNHIHFQHFENLAVEKIANPDGGSRLMEHQDFTSAEGSLGALTDGAGHGTHVAGIIAGGVDPTSHAGQEGITLRAYGHERDSNNNTQPKSSTMDRIFGVAPQCKLLSLKVLNENGEGRVSNIIAALGYIQHVNDNGRWLHIQGVNLSVGYPYDAEWFACGQSPLCVEVDRLVRSGVVVVAAAGNTGYGFQHAEGKDRPVRAGIDLTINDPGNAEAAITVGATHRDKPHIYGVSYFSSKGPTGDGRLKPDLVAPGEKVISCAAGRLQQQVLIDAEATNVPIEDFDYVESSGTSMAAPHVSGAVAAFLSIRREFVGQAYRVKEIFLETATDLNRERYFQGYGLVDLMRAIQSV